MIEVTRLWEKGDLTDTINKMNKVADGVGDNIFKILEEAESRHEKQMLKLQIDMLEEFLGSSK